MDGNKINKLDHPTDSKDGANKMYVDTQIDFPSVINSRYTQVAKTEVITVSGSGIQTQLEDCLTKTTNLVEPRKIVEVRLSFNRNVRLGFFLDRTFLALFGEFDYIDGFVDSVEIAIFQPFTTQQNIQSFVCTDDEN